MIAAGRFAQPRHIGQRRQAGIAPPRHHLQPLGDQRAIDARQRHHIADRPQGDQIEPALQIGLGPPRAIPAGPAQGPVDGHGQQEGDPDGGQLAMALGLVEPVGIDHRDGGGKAGLGHMMVDDDDLEPRGRRGRQRLEGGDAAVDGDDQPHAFGLEGQQRRQVRAVALLHPVGDIDADRPAGRGEEAGQQRRGGSAIDVVIAEDGDGFARLHRPGEAVGRLVHIEEAGGIGQQFAQGGAEEAFRRLGRDAAAGQQAAHDLRQRQALGDGEPRPLLAAARAPAPSQQGALDAEEGLGRHGTPVMHRITPRSRACGSSYAAPRSAARSPSWSA